MQKRLLYEFPDAVDLPSGYDKVLRFIILQHQPHGLEREAEPRESCTQLPLGNYHVTNAHHRTGTGLTGKLRHTKTLRSLSEHMLIPKVFRRLPTQGQRGKAFTEEKRSETEQSNYLIIWEAGWAAGESGKPGELLVKFHFLGFWCSDSGYQGLTASLFRCFNLCSQTVTTNLVHYPNHGSRGSQTLKCGRIIWGPLGTAQVHKLGSCCSTSVCSSPGETHAAGPWTTAHRYEMLKSVCTK